MTALRRFLAPGWIIGVIAAIAFSYFAFGVLAPWQLSKNQDLKARNDQLRSSIEAPPVVAEQIVGADSATIANYQWHLVSATGRYLPDEEAIVRLRPVDGQPAFHILTVFRTTGGANLLVDRGAVRQGADSAIPDYPAPPPEEVTIAARVRVPESVDPNKAPITTGPRPLVTKIAPDEIGVLLGTEVEPLYLQLSGDQPGVLEALPPPAIETGPYLSYGFQWIVFGVMVPLGLLYFGWREVSERRMRAEANRTGASKSSSGGEAAGRPGSQPGPAAGTDSDSRPRGGSSRSGDEHSPDRPAADSAMEKRYGDRFISQERRSSKNEERF